MGLCFITFISSKNNDSRDVINENYCFDTFANVDCGLNKSAILLGIGIALFVMYLFRDIDKYPKYILISLYQTRCVTRPEAMQAILKSTPVCGTFFREDLIMDQGVQRRMGFVVNLFILLK